MSDKNYESLVALAEKRLGPGPLRFFTAPGRTEIGGNHTDHQQGRVLAAAVNLEAAAAVRPNADNTVRIYSEKYPVLSVDLSELSPRKAEEGTSEGLVRGVAEFFVRHGYPVGGFDAVTENHVPGGSGLSSSAAFEVLVGTIFSGLYGGEVPAVTRAMAGQYAENAHFGKPCGLMDQMASAVGGFVAIDFHDPKNPVVQGLGVRLEDYGHVLCIVSTGGSHNDLTGEYAAIPAEMRAVAACLGAEKLGYADEAAFYANLAAIRRQTGDRAVLRAMHFFDDNRRVLEETDALERGDFAGFLRLINSSGRSSWEYLQNISPMGAIREQPVATALAYAARLLGGQGACRVHGGGFAGTIQAFVPAEQAETFVAAMETLTGAGSCRILNIRAEGGVEITF